MCMCYSIHTHSHARITHVQRKHIEAYIGTHTCLYTHQCPHTNAPFPLTSHTHVPTRACPVRWHPPLFLMETLSRWCHPQHPPVMWWRNLYAEGKEGSSRCCGHNNGGLCHMLNQLMVEIHLTAVPLFSQHFGTRSD